MNNFYPISFNNQTKMKEGHNMFDAQLVAKLQGWKVFSANPENKTPLIKDQKNRASNKEKVINRLFAPFPNAMFAVPTGPVNGITIIDFDIRDSYNGVSNFIQEGYMILKTSLAKTPSGGFHLYFGSGDQSIPNSVSKLAIGVDVRGDGGYVIAPPSQSIKGTYKWETDWIDRKRIIVIHSRDLHYNWKKIVIEKFKQ